MPTWVCEVDDDDDDSEARLALHARAGVRRAWRVNPVTRSLTALVLGPGNRLQEIAAQCSRGEWRLPPFEAVPIAAASLWEP